MAIDTLVLQPGEKRLYDLPFTRLLRAGDNIQSVLSGPTSTLVEDPGGSAALTLSGTLIGGQVVQFNIEAGAGVLDGALYRIDAQVQSVNGDKPKAEGLLRIRDIK